MHVNVRIKVWRDVPHSDLLHRDAGGPEPQRRREEEEGDERAGYVMARPPAADIHHRQCTPNPLSSEAAVLIFVAHRPPFLLAWKLSC